MNYNYSKERNLMVSSQLESRGIKNKAVLDVMREIPRHIFVSKEQQYLSYEDCPLPIENNQTISQPYIVGLMTELAEPDSNRSILEIGTGCGYQTAVLAKLFKEVYTIERIPVLFEKSQQILNQLNFHSIKFLLGNGYQGWKEHGPYDRIIVTACPPVLPEKLVDELKPGGIMVIPIGSYEQILMKIVKNNNGTVDKTPVIPVRFVPLLDSY